MAVSFLAKTCVAAAFLLQSAAIECLAQTLPDADIDAATRAEVITALAEKLRANYVFPELAEKMAQTLLEREKRGEYRQFTRAKAFAETLVAQLRDISHDKHIQIRYSKNPLPPDAGANTAPDAAALEAQKNRERAHNYGVRKFEHLPGNIAYLELTGFADPALGGNAVASLLTIAADADALIIDLRRNGGGSPEMVAFVSSYLFDGEPVHLNDLQYRQNNQTIQYWTHPYVPGKRFGAKKPVYVLTSPYTFSGAEEFCYNLKNLKRATIIGATTGGGANPGDVFSAGRHFSIFIPTGRAVNPITKTNWEGVGVAPDIAIAPEQALHEAQMLALKTLHEQAANEDLKAGLAQHMQRLQQGQSAKL